MKRLRTIIACVLSTVSLLPLSVLAADDFGKGGINWVDGYIDAVGYGTAQPSGNRGKDRLNARRAAEATVQRALLETIKGVRIDSMTTVENSMLKEDIIRTRVDGIIKGAQTIEEKVEWEGNAPVVMVKMRICLTGGVADCKGASLVNVLNLEKREEPPFVPQKRLIHTIPVKQQEVVAPPVVAPPVVTPVVVTPPVVQPPADPVVSPVPVPVRRSYVYDLTKPVTGIVLTLEGRYFERSLLPVVVTKMNDDVVTVYSAKIVKPEVIRTYGAVRYADTTDNAVKVSHLGSNILVLPVADISKDNLIIITPQDAATIRETLSHGNDYLGEAKVVISVK